MADRLDFVGPRYAEKFGLCHAVSCIENGNLESVQRCLTDVAAVLGGVSDTLSILSDFSSAEKTNPGIVGISDGSMAGATCLMSDVVGLCACLSNACADAIPTRAGGMINDGE